MSYFKPLRRKLGLLILLMACVFVAGWLRAIRGRHLIDSGRFIPGRRGIVFEFLGGSFILWKRKGDTIHLTPDGSIDTVLLVSDASVILEPTFAAPCWSIVLPLALVAAYLLLSKPRVLPSAPKADMQL